MNLLDVLQEPWALRALLASSMVGVMCGILGSFIVLRNMSLIGDALAHAILPGVVFAFMLVGQNALGFFLGSVIAGLLTAFLITWIQQKVNTKNDAAIGIVFTAMFSIGIIGISSINRQPGVHLDLKDFLFGSVLGVSNEDLWLTFGVLLAVLLGVILFYRYLFATTFQAIIAQTMGIPVQLVHYFLMLLLAFAVVASLRTVGVILVVAMLITPASTALLLSNRLERVLFIAAILGLCSAVIGFILAIVFETTPGPAMAVTATVIYLFAILFAPEKGLVFQFFRKRKMQRQVIWEDILKQLLHLEEQGSFSPSMLAVRLKIKESRLMRHIQVLRAKKLMEKSSLQLTERGREVANKLIRAHRLWETYQVEQMGLTHDQIHDEAEKYEHFLSEEFLDELDHKLGYPALDPHGSPIPTKSTVTLLQLQPEHPAFITHQQISNLVTAQLWDLGLMPDLPVSLRSKEEQFLEVEQQERKIKIPIALARAVSISMHR